MPTSPDVIVAGLGAVGSAALYQLSLRGARALGFDRFRPPHDHGSSHGDSRITRLALGEGAHYVQFARRSHEIWRELEARSGETLFHPVGCLIYGSTSARSAAHGASDFLHSTLDVAERYGIAHARLDAAALRRRFPQFRFGSDDAGCFEPGAGLLHPERCIGVQLDAARRNGATVQHDERLLRWTSSGASIEVVTDRAVYQTSHLILSGGAWLPELVPALAAHARVFRQVMFWFAIDGEPEQFTPAHMPVYVRLADASAPTFYGFPAIDGPHGGLKVAGEQFAHSAPPDAIDPAVAPGESAAMYACVAPHLRVGPRCLRSAVCKYTATIDFDFVIDQAPDCGRVWFASACSGHGFKHSAAVGEALAEIAGTGRTRFDLSRFALARFRGARADT